jgi:ribosomal protein S18 acetylase RimI-like enzyme
MFYCNDLDSKRAYISYFAVLSEHRRNGLGGNLMEYSINKSIEMGMACISVHTWRTNKGTLDTYNRMGFNIIDDGIGVYKDRVLLEKFLV